MDPHFLDLGRFTPAERAPGIHWIGGWVNHRAGLNDVEKTLDPTGTRTPDPSAVQPVASRYTDYAIPVPTMRLTETYSVVLFLSWANHRPRREC
jgi:hypothetical protein